jgi:hypothetical protein
MDKTCTIELGFQERLDQFSQYQKEKKMKLTPPKNITWWIAVVLGVLGLLGKITNIPIVTGLEFWFVFVAFAILVLATLLKDL